MASHRKYAIGAKCNIHRGEEQKICVFVSSMKFRLAYSIACLLPSWQKTAAPLHVNQFKMTWPVIPGRIFNSKRKIYWEYFRFRRQVVFKGSSFSTCRNRFIDYLMCHAKVDQLNGTITLDMWSRWGMPNPTQRVTLLNQLWSCVNSCLFLLQIYL